MEKKVIKLEDLKEGMKLRGVKNLYYVSGDRLDEGLMVEEDVFDNICLMIEKGSIWEVGKDEDELYVVFDGESNEGFFDLEYVLEKEVFEIV
jgi:ABC-type sugar transport system ATPase subunit